MTDAATVAAAKSLVGKLLRLPGDRFRVSLTRKSGSAGPSGEARDLNGHLLGRFGLVSEMNGLWLAVFSSEQSRSTTDQPMDIAKAEARTKAVVSVLYPRWKGRNMITTSRRVVETRRSASGGAWLPRVYEFAWGEAPKPGIRTGNEVKTMVLANTGAFLLYSARLAAEPVRYPTIAQADARKIADAAIKTRYQHRPRTRIVPVSAVCWAGGPKAPPIWIFSYKIVSPSPDGQSAIESGDSVRVHGSTGAVISP
ncbi:MAG: hypothetical protein HPY69_19795 [Armatimonadetes bacterium]|nr:hypothetical protein [Armatimonadota bacterium]